MNRQNNSVMSRISKPLEPRRRSVAAVRFPSGKFCGWIALLVIGAMFVYRLSETGGKNTESACLLAIVVSLTAAMAGFISIYKVWGRSFPVVLLGIFLSGAIRLLIGAVGTVIIIAFTATERTSFVGFLALFYVVFLVVDTWLALWVLHHTKIDDDNQVTAVHGNVWDLVGKYRSAQRSGQ